MAFVGVTQTTQLITGIILVRLISKEMLGDYRQVMLVYTLIAAIFSLQIENSLYYFLPKFGLNKRREIVAQTLLTTGFCSLLIAIVMFCSADLFAKNFNNPNIAMWIRIYACFPIFDRIVQLVPAFLISLDKAQFSGLYSTLSTVSMVSTVVVLFALGYGITQAILGNILVEAVFAFIGILLMMHFSPIGNWRINKTLLLEQLNYCWPLMATTAIGIINLKLDGLLISYYFSKEVYAVYSIGAVELPLVALFTSSLSSAIMPNMVTEADQGRKLNTLSIWHEAARKSSLFIFPAFAFFLVCGYDFIILFYTQNYSSATLPFLIYLTKLPFRVAIYGAIFRAMGLTKPLFIAALLSLITNLCVGISLLYLGQHSLLSYIGPSVGSVMGTLVSVYYLLSKLSKNLDICFREVMRWKELGRILAISLFCGILLWLTPIPPENLFVKMVLSFVVYIIYFFITLVLTKSLHSDEWELIRRPVALIRG